MMADNPTKETYDAFQKYYEIFNDRFFNGQLPNCLITYQRGKSYEAYFLSKAFKKGTNITDEIAMNPEAFIDRSKAEVLATFLHEIIHLWQFHFGKPSRGGYHNREWADKMKEVGLQPFGVGTENYGKETGQKLNHKIIEGGPFDQFIIDDKSNLFEMWVQSYKEFDFTDIVSERKQQIMNKISNHVIEPVVDNLVIDRLEKIRNELEEVFLGTEEQAKILSKESGSKIKYSCQCQNSLWAKVGLNILCLDCKQPYLYDL